MGEQAPAPEQADRDQLRRFVFEQLPVHGRLVRLNAACKAVMDLHPYPAPVRRVLGQALVASVLMAATLKFRGQLTLQLQGEGALKLLVVQCTDQLSLRGLARYDENMAEPSFAEMVGNGRMVVTLEREGGKNRYQGIVPLDGASLAQCLEAYFAGSEQLPTRFYLAAADDDAAGMLIQELPGSPSQDADGWSRINLLADTLTDAELLGLGDEQLLTRLFHQEQVRLFESRRVTFSCLCTRERVEGVLKMLGEEEINSVLNERGEVEVHCEFCNKPYRFDEVDTARLFASGMGQGSGSVH